MANQQEAWLVWVSGGGCDGCTMSVLGATAPRLEELLSGALTQFPRIGAVHPVLALDSGRRYIDLLEKAAGGGLDPFILVVEGSMFDEELAGEGTFSGLGERDGQPIPVEEWVRRLAPRAAAVVAIGTCATWGGIPAARGSPTGSMSLTALLGESFRTGTGLPIVNLPGCAPNGDAFVETVSYVLHHLAGLVPIDLDEQGRPRWLYSASTSLKPAGVNANGLASKEETADCPVPARGWINRLGGCAAVGGSCNGCTRPDFPDRALAVLSGH